MGKMTEKQVVEYNITDAAIAEMESIYMGLEITDLDDKEQYDAVHQAHMVVRGKRIEVDKKRKELKADALAWGKKVQAEANRIFSLIEPIESHLKAEKQKVKDEQERLENERVKAITKKMSDIQGISTDATLISAEGLKTIIADIDAIKIEPEEYFEFTTEAIQLKQMKMTDACNALESRERMDKEEAERKAEAERLAKIQEEQDRIAAEQKAAQDKIDEENRKLQAERDKIEAEKKAAQEQKDREEFERQAKIKVEANAKAAAEQAERDRAEAEKIAKEAAIREEMLRPDKDKLLGFSQFLSESVIYPNCDDPIAKSISTEAYKQIQAVAEYVAEAAENL